MGLQLKGGKGGERGGGKEAATMKVKEAVEEEATAEVEVKMEMAGKMEKNVYVLVICALEFSDI